MSPCNSDRMANPCFLYENQTLRFYQTGAGWREFHSKTRDLVKKYAALEVGRSVVVVRRDMMMSVYLFLRDCVGWWSRDSRPLVGCHLVTNDTRISWLIVVRPSSVNGYSCIQSWMFSMNRAGQSIIGKRGKQDNNTSHHTLLSTKYLLTLSLELRPQS